MWIQIESEDEGLGPTAESSSKADCESHWTHKERILVPQEREKREIEGRNTTTPFLLPATEETEILLHVWSIA